MKRTINLTSTIAQRPFYKDNPKRVSGWTSFWISNAFWSFFVILFISISMSSMEFGVKLTNRIMRLKSELEQIQAENAKSIAQRDAKIEQLLAFHSSTTVDLISLAKTIQEIYSTADTSKQAHFLDEALPEALRLQLTEGVPASACVAMAIYESQYGQSKLAREHHNYFGMKAFSNWDGKRAVDMTTRDSGVVTTADFRAYDSLSAGFDGYAYFLKNSDRYDRAFKAHNGVEFVSILLRSGYCPDSTYLDAIRNIMERHKLYKLDTLKSDQIVNRAESAKADAS